MVAYSCPDSTSRGLRGHLRDEDHASHRLSIVVSWGGASRRQKGGVRVLFLALGARRRCADVGRNALGQHRDPVAAAVIVAVKRELQPPEGGVNAHQPYDSLSSVHRTFSVTCNGNVVVLKPNSTM